jgi:hypothetical protein
MKIWFYILHVDPILDNVTPCNIGSFNVEWTTNWFWTENEKNWTKKNTYRFNSTWFQLELHPDLVFQFGIGWYFLGIFLTNTGGKLGWYVLVSYIWWEPLFPSLLPSFWWTKPPFWGEFPQNFTKWSSRQILQYKNTVHTKPNIPTGKCR